VASSRREARRESPGRNAGLNWEIDTFATILMKVYVSPVPCPLSPFQFLIHPLPLFLSHTHTHTCTCIVSPPFTQGELLREIDLLGSTEAEAVATDEVDGNWEWIFKVHGADRVFVFSAGSEIERTEWVKMIRFVIGFVHRA
jgi:hypothetical protein